MATRVVIGQDLVDFVPAMIAAPVCEAHVAAGVLRFSLVDTADVVSVDYWNDRGPSLRREVGGVFHELHAS